MHYCQQTLGQDPNQYALFIDTYQHRRPPQPTLHDVTIGISQARPAEAALIVLQIKTKNVTKI